MAIIFQIMWVLYLVLIPEQGLVIRTLFESQQTSRFGGSVRNGTNKKKQFCFLCSNADGPTEPSDFRFSSLLSGQKLANLPEMTMMINSTWDDSRGINWGGVKHLFNPASSCHGTEEFAYAEVNQGGGGGRKQQWYVKLTKVTVRQSGGVKLKSGNGRRVSPDLSGNKLPGPTCTRFDQNMHLPHRR